MEIKNNSELLKKIKDRKDKKSIEPLKEKEKDLFRKIKNAIKKK